MNAPWLSSFQTWSALWASSLWRACWQGTLIILAVWVVCRLLPRLSAAVRCWLWWLACLKLLVALVWPGIVPLPLLPPSLESAPALSPPVLSEPVDTGRRIANRTGALPRSPAGETARSTTGRAAPPQPPSGAGPAARSVPSGRSWPPWLMNVLLGVWFAGVAVQGWRTLGQFRASRRLMRGARPLEEGAIREEGLQLGILVGLSQPPLLLESDAAPGPLVVGLVRPVVALPPRVAEAFSTGELRMALAHELAHLRRGDLWLAWVPALAQILFYFHPLVWLACREWATAREAACDAAAVEATEAAPAEYGKLFLKLVSAGKGADVVPALGTTTSYHTLHGRLKMLQQVSMQPRRWVRAGIMLLVALMGMSVLPWRLTARSSVAPSGEPGAAQPHATRAMVLRQVWAGADVDTSGTVSTDGRHLSFVSWKTGDVAIRDLATGTNRRLTDKGSWEQSEEHAERCILSPDGTQVAFSWTTASPSLKSMSTRRPSTRTRASSWLHPSRTAGVLSVPIATPSGRRTVGTLPTRARRRALPNRRWLW